MDLDSFKVNEPSEGFPGMTYFGLWAQLDRQVPHFPEQGVSRNDLFRPLYMYVYSVYMYLYM